MGDSDVLKLAADLRDEMNARPSLYSAILSRRGVLAAMTSTAFWPLIAKSGRASAAQREPAVNIRLFGAAGNGIVNDTLAIQRALWTSRTIYVPAGTYLVDAIVVPAGTTLLTDGGITRFKQRPGIGPHTPIIAVRGSNVVIGDCTVEGNIAMDSGEQRHGIFIQAAPETGPIVNVRVGNIKGVNIRGDVVYVGSRRRFPVADVQIGNVHGSNILRNVVSVVGGQNIRIGDITGSNVGYTHLDIEPDQWNAPVRRCDVDSVRGGFVQIAGQTASSAVDGVRIGLLNLTQPPARSIPIYPPGLKQTNALTLRNVRSADIGRMIVRGFTGSAITQVWDRGALPDQFIHIGQAELSDCCKGRGRNAYIQGSRNATHLAIDSLAVTITKPGVDVVRDCKSARVSRVTGMRPQGSRLIALNAPIAPQAALAAAGAVTTAVVVGMAFHNWR